MKHISQLFIKIAFTIIISSALFSITEKQSNNFFVMAQIPNQEENIIALENEKSQVKIMKPLIDSKSYKFIELDNKLKVVLIHDPNSEISSAALDVKVGSWNEPDQYPGLAHFLEHMLFGGSQKYSRSDYFDNLLAKGSGSSNAYTDSTNTNYYFDITSNLFGKAIDVFAHFFIDPLFNEELVQREINAVDSEYQIDVSSEEWKIQNLFNIFAKKQHPASRFSIGNIQVLKKQGIKEELVKFFQENYSSNLMSLVVQSSMSLDQMEKIIQPFRKIQNLNNNQLQVESLPYQFGLICKYKSDRNQLTLNWQLEGREKYIHQKPIEFLDYIITNGNLDDFLKDNDYIVSISSEVYSETEFFSNYMIQMELKENQKQIEVNVAEITKIIHNYFQKVEEWLNDEDYLQNLFQDQKQISKLNFNYLDDTLDVSTLAKNLNQHKPQELISQNFIIDQLDKDLIMNFIQQFKNTDNLILLVAQDDFEYSESEEPQTNNKQFLKSKSLNKKSDLYRLIFSDQKMDEHFTHYISTQDSDLQSNFKKPEKNEFIPKNVEMISLCKSQSSQLPEILHADKLQSLDEQSKLNLFLMSGQNLNQFTEDQCMAHEKVYQKTNHYPILLNKEKQEWWKSATQYNIPYIFGALSISYPKSLNIKQFTSLKIYNVLIEELTERELKLPISTGYNIEFNLNQQSEIKLYGFSEHVRNLFKKICSCMNPFRDKTQSFIELGEGKKFENAKEFLSISIKKMYQDDLFEQALNIHFPSLLYKDFHNPKKVLAQIQDISKQEMIQNVKEILGNTFSSSLFVGNLNQQEAQEISDDIKQCANQKNEEKNNELIKEKTTVIDLSGKNLIYSKFIESGNKDDLNGVTLNYYQISKRNNKNYAFMKLLEPIMNQQAFNYLRTELQLGYLVEVKFKTSHCIDGAIVLVQGSKEIPMKVNSIIEQFLEQFASILQEMDQKEFQRLKHSVITELKEKPQSLSEEGNRLWENIKNENFQFESRQVTIEQLKHVSKDQLIQFYEKHFLKNNSKFSLQLYGQGMVEQMMNIETQAEFKEFVQNTKPQNSEIFNEDNLSYYQCNVEEIGL